MENYLWQKTLLDTYHSFDRGVMLSDNKIDRLVVASLRRNDTLLLCDEMLSIMARKNNCLLAKSLVDSALEALGATGDDVLHCYYRCKMSFKDIAEKKGINIRQVFRNYDKELAKFAYSLSKMGYDSTILGEEFGCDGLFVTAYNRLQKKASDKMRVNIQLTDTYVDDAAPALDSRSFCRAGFIAAK